MGHIPTEKETLGEDATWLEWFLWKLAKCIFWTGLFLFALVAWPVLLVTRLIRKLKGK